MHRFDLFAKTGGQILISVMQFANGFNGYAFSLQPVPPTFDSAVIGHGVVPITGLVGITTGSENGSGRNANRRVRIGGSKARPLFRQSVKVGRFDLRMAVTAEHFTIMLVGHDEEDV